MTLNERLKYYRGRAGLSQEEVAEALHVTRQAVSKWETGAAAPDVETLTKLARRYQLSLVVLTQSAEGPGRAFPFDSLHWRPKHKLVRPAALERLKMLGLIYGGLAALFAVAGVYVWAMSAMRLTLLLFLIVGAALLFGASAAVCNAARSGIEALFVELTDQCENLERRFQMLREQVRDLEP